MTVEAVLQSPLVKLFPEEGPQSPEYSAFSALPGEVASFQVAYRGDNPRREDCRVRVASALAPYLRVRGVELSPSTYPCHLETDDFYLRTTPGLYPDYLKELPNGRVGLIPGQWRCLWVDVELPEEISPGGYEVTLCFETLEEGALLAGCSAKLEVKGAPLPKQRLIHTEWFYSDCLADYYRVPPLSEAWWGIVANYIETAAKRGVNMILTPTFTPALDTAQGAERTTVQLVEVFKNKDAYAFGFDRLKRWIDLCHAKGVEYIEMAHLFTQWGAKAAPKVMAWEKGEQRRIFGWDTPATDEAYAGFLRQYLPALLGVLRQWGVLEKTYFHISDEPSHEHLESYLAAKEVVAEALEGCHIIDALSDFAFYEQGVVECPVPSNDRIGPFLEHNVKPLWTYYCTAQAVKVSNRFFAMPSLRNRILGVQLYCFGLQGFLHWGYNFYNSALSRELIHPFAVTDAQGVYPSGDAFLVYPNADGTAGESIRLMVLFHALQDMRAFALLESLAGRDFVLSLVNEGLEKPIAFDEYPKDDAYLLALRERVNQEIALRVGSAGSL